MLPFSLPQRTYTATVVVAFPNYFDRRELEAIIQRFDRGTRFRGVIISTADSAYQDSDFADTTYLLTLPAQDEVDEGEFLAVCQDLVTRIDAQRPISHAQILMNPAYVASA